MIMISFLYVNIMNHAKNISKTVRAIGTITARKDILLKKLSSHIIIITVSNLLCWLPTIVVGMMASFHMSMLPDNLVVAVAIFIMPINSAVNPLIYSFCTSRFRKCVADLLCCK